MQNFIFNNPVKILFGRGTVPRVGPETSRHGKRALLVYGGKSLKQNGLYAVIVKSLEEAGISVVEHPGVRPNPVISHVRAGIKLAKENNCDVVVAAGGGSAIDSAKAIAAGVKVSFDVWDFFTGK
ncbi:MAG: iron-containing alcohol dehydrogenase, partial [bacterium]